MSQAVVGALRVSLGLNSAQFTKGLSAAQRSLRTAGQRLQSIGTGMAAVGTGLTAAITAPLIGLGAMAVAEATEMRDALGSVQASLTALGDAGGHSLESLRGQAEALARTSLFEDDQILRGVTTNLISFGNIAGEQFRRAQQASVDLAAKLGVDLPAAAALVGRALTNPGNAAAVLTRRFGAMPQAVQDNIAALTAMGDTAGAQGLVLDYLNTKIAGQAQAARDNAPPLVRMNLALKEMAGSIGTILLPFVDKIATAFEGLTEKFGKLSPGMQQFVVVAGLAAAALGPLLIVGGAIVASLGVLLPIVGAISLPFLAIAAAVAAVGVAFWVFRDDIIPIVQSFAASLQENIGPKIAPLWEAIKGAVAAVGDVFNAIFGGEGPDGIVTALKFWGEWMSRTFGAAIDIVTGVINVITNIFRALGALLRGDFSAMWGYLGQAVMSAVRGIANAFQTLFPEVVSWVRQTYEGVKLWLAEKLLSIFRGVIDKVKGVSDAFFNLYDAVVGNSYVPDMVNGIAEWMAKLDAGMVNPALRATDATREAFESLRDDVARIFESLLTDSERATRQLAADMATLDKARAQGLTSQTEYEQARGGVAAEGLRTGRAMSPLGAMADGLDIAEALRGGVKASQDAFDDAANAFADTFARGMGRVLGGDIKGLFNDLLRDVMGDALRGLGRSIFGAMGGGKPGGGNIWGAILGALKVPGFKMGGTFKVGGSGGADSQLMQFRATPGEMVDIRRPGQDRGGSSPVHFDLRGAVMTADLLQQMEGMAIQAGVTAYGATRSDMASAQRRSRQRFV